MSGFKGRFLAKFRAKNSHATNSDFQNSHDFSPQNLAKNAVIIASFCAFFLAVIKFIAGIFSGSAAVMASALDSLIDFAISAFNFLALKKSAQKPNENYNFGFSKIEALAGLFQGLFIAGVGVFIFYFSALKFTQNSPLLNADLTLFVMIFATFITLFLVIFLEILAQKTQNLILKSDAAHYKSDLLTNLATLFGLFIFYFTGFSLFDAVLGVLISLYTIFNATKIIKKSVEFLLDRAVSCDLADKIRTLITQNAGILGFHEFKTRQSPGQNFLSVHLVFDPQISLLKAHEIGDEIMAKIRENYGKNWVFDLHFDTEDDRYKENL